MLDERGALIVLQESLRCFPKLLLAPSVLPVVFREALAL
jgi:hypothetical protein